MTLTSAVTSKKQVLFLKFFIDSTGEFLTASTEGSTTWRFSVLYKDSSTYGLITLWFRVRVKNLLYQENINMQNLVQLCHPKPVICVLCC